MARPEQQSSPFQSRVGRSTRRLFLWTFAWLLATALLAFGPELVWGQAPGITLLAFGVTVAIGIGMIVSNKKHMQTLDELHRKVIFDAMGITLGVVLIVGVPYSLLEAYQVVLFSFEIAALYVLMSVTFLTSVIVGLRRYR